MIKLQYEKRNTIQSVLYIFYIFRIVHFRIILVGKQLDAQFLL